MFEFKFCKNSRLIKLVEISGPFITIYIDEKYNEDFIKFIKKFSQSNKTRILSIGEGWSHTLAHTRTLSGIISSHDATEDILTIHRDSEHFHIDFGSLVTKENIVLLFSQIGKHFNKKILIDLDDLLIQFQKFKLDPFKSIFNIFNTFDSRISGIVADNDCYLAEFIKEFNKFCRAPEFKNIDGTFLNNHVENFKKIRPLIEKVDSLSPESLIALQEIVKVGLEIPDIFIIYPVPSHTIPIEFKSQEEIKSYIEKCRSAIQFATFHDLYKEIQKVLDLALEKKTQNVPIEILAKSMSSFMSNHNDLEEKEKSDPTPQKRCTIM